MYTFHKMSGERGICKHCFQIFSKKKKKSVKVTKNVQPKNKPSKTKRTEKKHLWAKAPSISTGKVFQILSNSQPVVFQSTDDGRGKRESHLSRSAEAEFEPPLLSSR